METHGDDRSIGRREAASSLPAHVLKLVFAAFVLSVLVSCAICREAAIRDAEQYAMQGYEVRIATYDLKLDGLLYGGFLWMYHAQAQVYQHGKWYWACELGGLCDEPTFRIKRLTVLWDPHEYKRAIRLSGMSGLAGESSAGESSHLSRESARQILLAKRKR